MTMERFRPMGLGDIFDEAFDLYKTNFVFLFLATAACAVPVKIITTFVLMHFFPDLDRMANDVNNLNDAFKMAGRLISILPEILTQMTVMTTLYLIGYGFLFCALIKAASACVLNEPKSIAATYRSLFVRFIPLSLTLALIMVPTVIAFCLCYLPALIPVTLFFFAMHAFSLEGQSYFGALGRSIKLVSGFAGRILGCMLVLFFLYQILSSGFQFPFIYGISTILKATGVQGIADMMFADHPARLDEVINEIGNGLFDLIALPFLMVVITKVYYDLRIRKEAFDLELIARGLGYPALAECRPFLPPVGTFAYAVPVSVPPTLVPGPPPSTPRGSHGDSQNRGGPTV